MKKTSEFNLATWAVSENGEAVFCLLGLVAFVAMAVASVLLG